MTDDQLADDVIGERAARPRDVTAWAILGLIASSGPLVFFFVWFSSPDEVPYAVAILLSVCAVALVVVALVRLRGVRGWFGVALTAAVVVGGPGVAL